LLILLQSGILPASPEGWKGDEMLALSMALVASAAAQGQAAPSQNYRTAYEFAHRCFVATSSYGDEPGARRAFDAAMRLGQLQNLSNRQLNADFDRFTAYESVRLVRDPRYKQQLLTECRTIGLAS
jgi:hypothetical protein